MAWQVLKRTDESCSAALHSCEIDLGAGEYVIAAFAGAFNPLVLPFLWAAALCFVQDPWTQAAYSLGRILVVLAATLLMKKVTARPRPVLSPLRASHLRFNFRSLETNCSMPSGDSAQAALFYTFLALHTAVHPDLCIVLTLGTMFARVFYACHYWSDTVVGAALGVAVGGLS